MKTGREILARRDPLTEEEWRNMVEARLKSIKPYLRDMTLKTIGSLDVMVNNFSSNGLKNDNPKVVSDRFSLETRGIFPDEIRCPGLDYTIASKMFGRQSVSDTRAEYRFWGITRDAEWIKIKIDAKRFPGGDAAEKVEIVNSDLADIRNFCDWRYSEIWCNLGEVVKKWAEHRRKLYEEIKSLDEEFRQERALAELVPFSKQ